MSCSASTGSPEARNELFTTLEHIGNRLWMPFQVAHEFHRNRLSVIAGQESFFGKTREELESVANDYLSKLKAFTARIALPQARTQHLEEMIRQVHAAVTSEVTKAETANEVDLGSRDSDEVLTRLEALFTDRVGEPMKPDELEAARKEARRRVDAKIPPGYMDKAKADPSGDYILWKQLLREASTRKVPTVLITDDRKEDWVRREHGLTLGPRTELREEMTTEAGVPFLIMSTETFLLHAKDYLQVSVSRSTVDQAKEIQEVLDRNRRRAQEEMLERLIAEERMLQQAHGNLTAERSRIHARIESLTEQITAYAGTGNDRERAELQMKRDSLLRDLGAVEAKLSDTWQHMRALNERLKELDEGLSALRRHGLVRSS
jgi:hypothetical protein